MILLEVGRYEFHISILFSASEFHITTKNRNMFNITLFAETSNTDLHDIPQSRKQMYIKPEFFTSYE